MHQQCRIELFGGLKVSVSDRVITHSVTEKNASLLASLAYYLGQKYTREVLSDLFWPEAETGTTNTLNECSTIGLRHETWVPL